MADSCEALDGSPGLDNLGRFDAEDDRDSGSLNLDLLGAITVVKSGGSLKAYRPVSGSASGASEVIVDRGKLAVPTKSLPDNLSLSITEKLSEYVCSWRITWKTNFSS